MNILCLFFQIVGENVPETLCGLTADKSVQVFIAHKFKSKAVQTTGILHERPLSPIIRRVSSESEQSDVS